MATYQGTFEDSNGNVLLNTPHSYAYIESGTTATRSYTKGDLFVFKNQLCQANADISTGATLTIGGNVLATSVANQLSNINVYVGQDDNKLHFVDHAGADSVLPFSSAKGFYRLGLYKNGTTAYRMHYYKDDTTNIYTLQEVFDYPLPVNTPAVTMSLVRKSGGDITISFRFRQSGYFVAPDASSSSLSNFVYRSEGETIEQTYNFSAHIEPWIVCFHFDDLSNPYA